MKTVLINESAIFIVVTLCLFQIAYWLKQIYLKLCLSLLRIKYATANFGNVAAEICGVETQRIKLFRIFNRKLIHPELDLISFGCFDAGEITLAWAKATRTSSQVNLTSFGFEVLQGTLSFSNSRCIHSISVGAKSLKPSCQTT